MRRGLAYNRTLHFNAPDPEFRRLRDQRKRDQAPNPYFVGLLIQLQNAIKSGDALKAKQLTISIVRESR